MRILIVDDEELQRSLLEGFLAKQGYDVLTAGDGDEALRLFSEHPVQLVLLDHKMPKMTGDETLARMKAQNPLVRAMMITAYGTVDTAVRAMKLGADDFVEKPVDLESLLEKIRRIEQTAAVEEEAVQVTEAMDDADLPVRVIGRSAAMKEVLSLVRRIAAADWTVLIRGETGCGKELIARLIHLLSERKNAPFIEVNCAAIPETLFESELFGHEKGAFTGASAARKGRFELADQGVLFLDEVGELPPNAQAKLLRSLQEKRIARVGGDREIPVNVRVIAATNRDLKRMVEESAFREDLYYRLNVLEVQIPPLRNRREDVPVLAEWFLNRYGSGRKQFDPDAMTTLVKYDFPGNVRELEHIIQRLVALCRKTVVAAADLPPEVRFFKGVENGVLSERLKSVEREMLISALERFDWVQTRAAESLGISERVLRYKMKIHDIRKSE